MNMYEMLQQIKSNPFDLLSRRFNLPQNMNDPNAILQHLLNTGQISQNQINSAMTQYQHFFGGKK